MAAGEMDVERRVDRRRAARTSRRSRRHAAWCRRRRTCSRRCRCRRSSPARICDASTASPMRLDRGDRQLRHSRRARPGSAGSARPSGGYRRRRDPARFWRGRASARRSPCRAAATTPIQFRPGLLLRVHADMRHAVERRPRRQRFGRHAGEGLAELLLDQRRGTCRCPMPSSTYFSRALRRLVRSPRSMKTRTMASATLVASAGLTMMPVSLAKSLWPVMPPMPEPKPDAGLDAETVLHLDRGEARCRWCLPAPRSCRRRRRRR